MLRKQLNFLQSCWLAGSAPQTPIFHLWGQSQLRRRSSLKAEDWLVMGLLGPVLAGPWAKAITGSETR